MRIRIRMPLEKALYTKRPNLISSITTQCPFGDHFDESPPPWRFYFKFGCYRCITEHKSSRTVALDGIHFLFVSNLGIEKPSCFHENRSGSVTRFSTFFKSIFNKKNIKNVYIIKIYIFLDDQFFIGIQCNPTKQSWW
jgi:hypothetical protein